MKHYIWLIFFFSLIFRLNGQQPNIELSSTRNKDQTVEINFTGQFYGHWYVKLIFSNLSNSLYSSFGHVIYDSKGTITKLRPIMEDRPINLRYRYMFWRGKPISEYNSKKVYLLPFSEGKKIKIEYLNHINNMIGQEVPESWMSYNFYSDAPDSIFSSRKGVIINVSNENKTDTTSSFYYQRNRNYILVEHEDGTLARYEGFDNKMINIKEGDKVLPGTYHGTLERYDKDPKKYLLFFTCYYLDIYEKSVNPGYNGNYGIKNTFITPLFFIGNSFQTLVNNDIQEVKHNRDVIISEMTKKEIIAYEKCLPISQ